MLRTFDELGYRQEQRFHLELGPAQASPRPAPTPHRRPPQPNGPQSQPRDPTLPPQPLPPPGRVPPLQRRPHRRLSWEPPPPPPQLPKLRHPDRGLLLRSSPNSVISIGGLLLHSSSSSSRPEAVGRSGETPVFRPATHPSPFETDRSRKVPTAKHPFAAGADASRAYGNSRLHGPSTHSRH